LKLNGNGPVFGIDIDGTLGDYHSHFIKFAEAYTGRKLPNAEDINPALPFSRFLGLGKSTYRQIKLAYRQGGMKRSMPCYAGARELTASLRKSGAEVWITTTRPFNQLGNVDPDTRHWLRRNGIQYDNILWGENKYRALSSQAGSRVAGVLEDLPAMIDQAGQLDIPTVLRSQPYNLYLYHPNRAKTLGEAYIYLHDLLTEWKDTQWLTRKSSQ
jgi:hypothetical protein